MKEHLVFCVILTYLIFNFRLISSDDDSIENDQFTNVKTDSPEHDTEIKKNMKEPSSKTDDEVVAREEEAIKLDGLNVAQLKEMRDKAEKFKFQAEVDRMMKLIINSLYTNKEIFLRELISNASDALDKIRFMSLTNPSVMGDSQDLSIKIKADKINNVLRITDTGIGMTRDELIKQLGTIANSGTTEFLSKFEKEKSENLGDFIGQFGVGFYSVYLVADSVTVISKSNDDEQHIWESDSSSQFTVTKDPRGNTLVRGTEVVIRLKPSAKEYLEAENLKRLIRQYSQYISFPIYLWNSKTVNETNNSDKTDEKDKIDGKNEGVTTTEESSTRNAPKVKWDWERINQNKPIWTRKTSKISDLEYDEFYKTLSKTSNEPLTRSHFSAEGEVTFKALLYIPSKAPQNLFERDVKESSIRLYVRRVFITDKIQDIIPRYLSFIIGIVDSDDLPLNISRETLQQEKLMKVIQKKLVRKALDMIKKMQKEKFTIFWKEFRAGIKMGLVDDDTNRNRLTKLMHTESSKSNGNITSFSEYISRMKQQQEEIFYIATESLEHAKSSPFVEKYVKYGYEVLYFTDSLDEHALYLVEKYDATKLLNLARGGISFDKTEGAKSRLDAKKSEYKALINFFKNDVDIVKPYIENVVLTDRLHSHPFVVVPQEQGWTGNMERLARSQSGKKEDDAIILQHLRLKKNLEVNYKHPIVIKLNRMINNHGDPRNSEMFVNYAIVLFETAMVNCGYLMNNTREYSRTLERLVKENIEKDNLQLWNTSDMMFKDEEVNVDADEDSFKYDETMNHAVPHDASDYASDDSSENESDLPKDRNEFGGLPDDHFPNEVNLHAYINTNDTVELTIDLDLDINPIISKRASTQHYNNDFFS